MSTDHKVLTMLAVFGMVLLFTALSLYALDTLPSKLAWAVIGGMTMVYAGVLMLLTPSGDVDAE